MTARYVFHLSIPVLDLTSARDFYINILGAQVGRVNDQWLDILLWGHQITLQLRPDEVLPPEQQGKRHFGVVLPWQEWERQVSKIRSVAHSFLAEPAILLAGTTDEQAKFYLMDPSYNVIEVKAYRDISSTLGVRDSSQGSAVA